MTSFFAQSFEFFSDKPASICAFLTTTRPIFNSSIIPVMLNMKDLWNECRQQKILEVFLHSDTLQFSPSLLLNSSIGEPFTLRLLHTLIHERRYFCRSLKSFRSRGNAALTLVCEKVSSLETVDCSCNFSLNLQPLVRLTLLKELNLSFTFVNDDDLRHLAGLTSLEFLSLSNSCISGKGFVHFSRMKSLRALDLSGMYELSDEGLLCLPALPSLVDLNLGSKRETEITDLGFASAVMKQTSLRTLDLSYCSAITTEGLKSLRNLPHLTDLNFSDCYRIRDESLFVLASMEGSLRRLSLACCRLITDEGVIMIVNEMKDLAFLDVSECQMITDASLKAISDLKFLTELKIEVLPKISDDGVLYLKKCPVLSSIDFGHSKCLTTTDVSLEIFSEMKNLSQLTLWHSSEFTNSGVAKLADSNSLETLRFWGLSNITNDGMLPLLKSSSLRRVETRYGSINNQASRYFEGSKIHFIKR